MNNKTTILLGILSLVCIIISSIAYSKVKNTKNIKYVNNNELVNEKEQKTIQNEYQIFESKENETKPEISSWDKFKNFFNNSPNYI